MIKNTEWLKSVLDEIPFKFWRCPDHKEGLVEWDDDVASYKTCGKTNKEPKNK